MPFAWSYHQRAMKVSWVEWVNAWCSHKIAWHCTYVFVYAASYRLSIWLHVCYATRQARLWQDFHAIGAKLILISLPYSLSCRSLPRCQTGRKQTVWEITTIQFIYLLVATRGPKKVSRKSDIYWVLLRKDHRWHTASTNLHATLARIHGRFG